MIYPGSRKIRLPIVRFFIKRKNVQLAHFIKICEILLNNSLDFGGFWTLIKSKPFNEF